MLRRSGLVGYCEVRGLLYSWLGADAIRFSFRVFTAACGSRLFPFLVLLQDEGIDSAECV